MWAAKRIAACVSVSDRSILGNLIGVWPDSFRKEVIGEFMLY